MFDTMISKGLIQVLWVLMSIIVIISVFASYQTLWRPTGGQVFLHLIYAAVGLIIVRVICESMIVVFMIHENLDKSARALQDIRSHRTFSLLPSSPVASGAPTQSSGSNPGVATSAPSTSVQKTNNKGLSGRWDGSGH